MTLKLIWSWPCHGFVDTAWPWGARGQHGTGWWQWEHKVRGQTWQASVPVRLRLHKERGRSYSISFSSFNCDAI